MSNPLFEEFVEWVSKRRAGTRINHAHGWSKCAVGKFAKYKGLTRFDVADCLPHPVRIELSEAFTNPKLATYGGLADFLKSYKEEEEAEEEV